MTPTSVALITIPRRKHNGRRQGGPKEKQGATAEKRWGNGDGQASRGLGPSPTKKSFCPNMRRTYGHVIIGCGEDKFFQVHGQSLLSKGFKRLLVQPLRLFGGSPTS